MWKGMNNSSLELNLTQLRRRKEVTTINLGNSLSTKATNPTNPFEEMS